MGRGRQRGYNLTAKDVEAAPPRERRYVLWDGRCLGLAVLPSGTRHWIVRTVLNGKRIDRGIGGYPDVSLAEARRKADEVWRAARQGRDLIAEQREAERLRRRAAEARAGTTFRALLEQYVASRASGWKTEKTRRLWVSSVEAWAKPLLDRPIEAISEADVRRAMTEVWGARPTTAPRILRRINAILRYGAALGLRDPWPGLAPRDLIAAGFPSLRSSTRFAALPWERLPAFWRALSALPPDPAVAAVKFIALTALRSGEARALRWADLDWGTFAVPVAVVPPEARKRRLTDAPEPHLVPLVPEHLAVLAEALRAGYGIEASSEAELRARAALVGPAPIFPSSAPGRPIGDAPVSRVLRQMNATPGPDGLPPWRDPDGRPAVIHGFRSSFRSFVDDCLPDLGLVAERQLGHREATRVSERYRRTPMLAPRYRLLSAWARWVVRGERPAVEEAAEMQRVMR